MPLPLETVQWWTTYDPSRWRLSATRRSSASSCDAAAPNGGVRLEARLSFGSRSLLADNT